MRPWLRTLAFLPLIVASLSLGASGKALRTAIGSTPRMAAQPVQLAPGDPARTRIGRLAYLGGVRLTSPDRGFSGFSALQVIGDAFVLVSDRGNVVRFHMGADWRPFDIRFGELPNGPGISAYKGDRDAESLTRDPVTGKFWVGFESHNVIWRFDADFRGERVAFPLEMRGWPANGGPESMARLPDGRFVVIGETARPPGEGHRDQREMLLFAGDPTRDAPRPIRLGYVPPPGYDPSDAVALPDGRLLVLVRRFGLPSLFTVRVELVDLRGAKPGAVLRGETIADFAPPFQHDNFEGLAVAREGDSTVLWMISDDNEQWWQQTLLLKFRLDL
ncbi:esterase-like activity of phytase family protein [Sphingomonas sp. HT-1]|uniref:esterase-like activity of phytase family protein n=1 Tax=unclassified Sphingomonas TaxID=196159 RepID=UPI0002E3A7F6|nr:MULTISPECIES: esterase-like activity of phytase family protein [unclassified Sphingomonas]KTF70363.1 hypothetical protein ATB93_04955 [Sphingomonas sp. WG]